MGTQGKLETGPRAHAAPVPKTLENPTTNPRCWRVRNRRGGSPGRKAHDTSRVLCQIFVFRLAGYIRPGNAKDVSNLPIQRSNVVKTLVSYHNC